MNPPEIGLNAGAMLAPAAADRYRTADVARILGVSPERVRRMVRSGHCAPSRQGRAYRFAFQDLVLLRTAHGLMLSGILSPKRVHRALRQLRSQLPNDRPLSGVRIYAAAGGIVVRDRETVWAPESGQQMFHFAIDDLLVKSSALASTTRSRGSDARAQQSAGDWFDYGVLIEHDDPNGARQAYERALEIDPDWTDAYVNLGRLVHEGGDPRGAAKFYGEALVRNPGDSVTHYNLAVAYEDLERLAKARAHYEQALVLNPSFADAHFNLGRILERIGERDAALKHLLAYRRLSDRI
jgi:Tfp pilus assembly protein PilF